MYQTNWEVASKLGTTLDSRNIKLVVCGRFDETSRGDLRPDDDTKSIIESVLQQLRKKELSPYAKIKFCNCGNAYEHGPSLTVLPERVRYMDLDETTIGKVIERHVQAEVRRGGEK